MLTAVASNRLTLIRKRRGSDLLHGGWKVASGLAAAAAPIDGLVGIRVGIHIQVARLLGKTKFENKLQTGLLFVDAILLLLATAR